MHTEGFTRLLSVRFSGLCSTPGVDDSIPGDMTCIYHALGNLPRPKRLRRVEFLFAPETMGDLEAFQFVAVDEILSRSTSETLSEAVVDIADRFELNALRPAEDARSKMSRLNDRGVLRLPHV